MFPSCPEARNNNKDDARICCLGFLTKIIHGYISSGKFDGKESADFYAKRIEQIIYENYFDRVSYVNRIAKTGLHLSNFTRSGRVSWIFKETVLSDEISFEELSENLVETINEDIIPEFFNITAVSDVEKQRFLTTLRMEESAILNGLNEIIRVCCDTKQCNATEMSETYDHVLFNNGNVFSNSMQQICYIQQVHGWIPLQNEVYIVNTSAGESHAAALSADVNSLCVDLMDLVDKLALLDDDRLLYLDELKNNLYPEIQADIVNKWNMEIQLRKSYHRLKLGVIV